MLGVAVPIQWYWLIQVAEQESAPFVGIFRLGDGIWIVMLRAHLVSSYLLGFFMDGDCPYFFSDIIVAIGVN